MSIADHLLPPCTVRITVRGEHSGTGFFVAPQTVATCAHVIESPSSPSEPIAAAGIRVVRRDGSEHAVDIRAFNPKPGNDLALLRLPKAITHPCVVLDPTTVLARDLMHTFAYPKDHLEGVPRSLDAEGATGNGRFALAKGVVQRGMSGAPLLSLRTGGVCGVVNRTRGQNTDFGGYAVPISLLLGLDSLLLAENDRYHATYREWMNALSPEQQSGRRAVGAGAAIGTKRFVVTIDETEHGWRVIPEDAEDIGVDEVSVDLNVVKSKVARLFRDWASRHGRVDEEEEVMLLGRILFSAAFPGPIGDRLVELMEQPGGDRVLVCLRFDPDLDREFRELPWEHLCLPEPHDIYLATDRRLSFARVPGFSAGDELAAPSSPPLRVVVAAVSPRDDQAGAAQGVLKSLQTTASEPPGLALEPLMNPNAGDVRAALPGDTPSILHYVGFGRFRNGVDQIAIVDDWGDDIDYLDADGLTDCLGDPPPQLVVLEQCTAPPKERVSTDFSVLAPALLDAGVGAVVAFQYLLSPHHSGLFNDGFYKALLAGEPVEFAVQAGRSRIKSYKRTFVSPTLFVRRPGELRLAPGGPAASGERGGAFSIANV